MTLKSCMEGSNGMNRFRITPKRTSIVQKAAYILKPFLVYMVVKTAAMLSLAMLIPALPAAGISEWPEYRANQLSAVINAVAGMIAVCFLLNDFLKEVAVSGEIDIDAGVVKQLWQFMKNGFWGYGRVRAAALACSALSGVLSAFILNFAIERLTGFLQAGSAKYERVETIQYSVPLWLGLILYGLISPVVEETVFRGVIYNRMKRFYDIPYCVILSAMLFGAFHANLPQFLYGTCMGILIAINYEKARCFAAPVVFHMAANAAVFLCSALQ